jgi:hypothetical protein
MAMEKQDWGQLVENMAIREVIDLHPLEIRLPIALDLPRWTAFSRAPGVKNDLSDVIVVFQYMGSSPVFKAKRCCELRL